MVYNVFLKWPISYHLIKSAYIYICIEINISTVTKTVGFSGWNPPDILEEYNVLRYYNF